MDRNFYNEEFEYFLKQKSDQYKMYPSDKVWNNINSSLHKTRRRIIPLLIILVAGSGLMVCSEIISNNYNKLARNLNENTPTRTSFGILSQRNTTILNNPQSASRRQFTKPVIELNPGLHSSFNSLSAPVMAMENRHPSSQESAANAYEIMETNNTVFKSSNLPSIAEENSRIQAFSNKPNELKLTEDITHSKKILIPIEPDTDSTLIKNTYAGQIGTIKIKRWGFQAYASPIASYRRLSNLNQSSKYVPVAINYGGNIDSYVHHKPGLGFEIGGRIQYKLSENLQIFTGLQFNYSRYYIDAFNYRTERATIALNTPVADTVANYTTIRNFQGYSPEQLQNQYFQFSVPLGAELKLLGNKRFQFNVAGSVQPTYLISSNAYLISSDFKNYIQDPNLSRKFNVHTSLEASVSYRWGGLRWQIGPQFRYQLMSSYNNKYPIREYLTEFGIKLGVSKTIW